MCEILQCGGGGEELLAEPCVSAHCSQTAVKQEDKAVWNNREFMWAVWSRREPTTTRTKQKYLELRAAEGATIR